MTTRLFRHLRPFQNPSAVYNLTVLSFMFALVSRSIYVLPVLLGKVLRDVPTLELILQLRLSIPQLAYLQE
jgi:hypothetical protein